MNKVRSMRVLVTGATGGIGRAICLDLLNHAKACGAEIAIAAAASKPGPALDALVAELHDAGARAAGFHANLADAPSCVRLAEQAIDFCGGLDLLVSNAGLMAAAPLSGLDVEQWDLVFNVDTRATWLLAKTARRALAESKGSVVAIASMAGELPLPNSGAYSVSKAALIMLCRQLAQEWAADEIRVNSISPGMIHTPLTAAIYQNAEVKRRREAMVPLGRIGQPEDIARAVRYLAGSDSSYATGINLRLDGGLCDSLLATMPGLPDKT
jgi:glucose 1-dehydrogenase